MPSGGIIIIGTGGNTHPRTSTPLPEVCCEIDNQSNDAATVHYNTSQSVVVPGQSILTFKLDIIVTDIT